MDLLSLVVHREADLVHHVIEFGLQRFNDVGRNKHVRFVQILDDEFAAECQSFVEMQQELFHSWVTVWKLRLV